MDTELIATMAFDVIGGLAIFLLGMHNMSSGLQSIAGRRLRAMIGAVTNNRFMAASIGTVVTMLIQSSSITTVMVIGFVNSSLMNLSQALGVIFGANIGTTITAWILVLKVGKYGLPVLAIAVFFYLFGKSDRVRYIGMAVMGVGMVFFGLEMMKNGFKPIRTIPEFGAWFHMFTADSYFGVLKCALAGCVLTTIVQSSSATIGITIGLASTGVINFHTAAALVLGENIGTTVTALLASLNASTNARRAAYGHVVFNLLGVAWVTALFPVYVSIIEGLIGHDPGMMVIKNGAEAYPHVRVAIAMAHTGFNVTNTLLFLPFLGVLAMLLRKAVPEKPFKEPPRLTRLDVRMLDTPMVAIEQSRTEIIHMAHNVDRMMSILHTLLARPETDPALVKKIFHCEEVLDTIQKEITVFLVDILSSDIPHRVVDEARVQIRIADEYESVSDYIVSILKLYLRLSNEGVPLPQDKREEIGRLHEQVVALSTLVNSAFSDRRPEVIPKVHADGNAVTHRFREIRTAHLARLSEVPEEPLLSVSYMNMVNGYRKIKDHLQNIAEALAGEK